MDIPLLRERERGSQYDRRARLHEVGGMEALQQQPDFFGRDPGFRHDRGPCLRGVANARCRPENAGWRRWVRTRLLLLRVIEQRAVAEHMMIAAEIEADARLRAAGLDHGRFRERAVEIAGGHVRHDIEDIVEQPIVAHCLIEDRGPGRIARARRCEQARGGFHAQTARAPR